jgi:prohead serine protease
MSSLIFSMRRARVLTTPVGRSRSPAPLVIVQDMPAAIRAVEGRGRKFSGVASSAAEDSMGDVIDVVGIDCGRWRQNGQPLLLDHRHDRQIGKVVRDQVVGDQWRVECELYPEGTTAEADQAAREIAAGGRSGLSIGFQPIEYAERVTSRGGRGIHYSKILLLELSSCVLPACAECTLVQRCAAHSVGRAVPRAGACGCRGTCRCEPLTLEVRDWPGDLVLELADDPDGRGR